MKKIIEADIDEKVNNNEDEDLGFTFKSELIQAQVENEVLVQKNHQKLIDAATRLFGKEGYHTTTIRQIVKESGIGIGSIYQYVKNKEEILVLILEYIFKRFEYKLSRAIEIDDLPFQRLKTGIDKYYRIIDNEYEKIILGYSSTMSLSSDYRPFVKELELKTNKIFEDILSSGIEQGQFNPKINVQVVAYDIIMFGHMWALKRWYFKEKMTIDEYIKEQMVYIIRMISN